MFLLITFILFIIEIKCSYSDAAAASAHAHTIIDTDYYGISHSDPCYNIIKHSQKYDNDNVSFCIYTRGKWIMRRYKNILSNEELCNKMFNRVSNLTLNELNDTKQWAYMKFCIDKYNDKSINIG